MPDKREQLPEGFGSIEEFWQFWDTHSSADYEDLMIPVDVEVDLLKITPLMKEPDEWNTKPF